VPLSAYAADEKPATYSKGLVVQWDWGIVRLGCGDFIRTPVSPASLFDFFAGNLSEWCIHWPMNEVVRIDYCPYASIENYGLRCAPRKQLALAGKHPHGQSQPTRGDRPALCRLFKYLYVARNAGESPDQTPNQRPDQVADPA
jgi:hypothetical protein